MRKPGERLPVEQGCVGEGIRDGARLKAVLHVRIVEDHGRVVVIDEVETPDPGVDREGGGDQAQADGNQLPAACLPGVPQPMGKRAPRVLRSLKVLRWRIGMMNRGRLGAWCGRRRCGRRRTAWTA